MASALASWVALRPSSFPAAAAEEYCAVVEVPSHPSRPPDRVTQPDLQFVTDDDPKQQVPATQALHLRDRKSWRDVDARVMRPAHGRIVVVVEIADRHCVEQSRLVA